MLRPPRSAHPWEQSYDGGKQKAKFWRRLANDGSHTSRQGYHITTVTGKIEKSKSKIYFNIKRVVKCKKNKEENKLMKSKL